MRTTGLVLMVLGGIMEGLFSLPVRTTPRWAWENIWGAGSLAALLLVPGPLLLLTIPHPAAVYTAAPTAAIIAAILYGAGWGLGGIFFGMGMAALGLSLGTSIIMGLVAIGGSIVPLLLQHHGQIFNESGLALIGGIVLMLLGLIVCSRAGSLKSTNVQDLAKPGVSFALGLF
jgi:L-rhamnose-H+ transport protein